MIAALGKHEAPPAPWIARARKLVVAVIGFAGEVVAAGLVHGAALQWLTLALGIATAAGVYTVPNAKP